MKALQTEYNVKTGESKTEEFEHTPEPTRPEKKGLNFDKLKKVLKKKGIITNETEVE